ncbi:MAG: hypothetical protein ACJ751_07735 [Niastella sp.]|uniref:hypothetical protein n=1 Tax=Niastella sp. TaxID=1869183 RepID=UPI00389AA483
MYTQRDRSNATSIQPVTFAVVAPLLHHSNSFATVWLNATTPVDTLTIRNI